MTKRIFALLALTMMTGAAHAQVGGKFACTQYSAVGMSVAAAQLIEKVITTKAAPSYLQGQLSAKIDGRLTSLIGASSAEECDVDTNVAGTYRCLTRYDFAGYAESSFMAKNPVIPTQTSPYSLLVDKRISVKFTHVQVCTLAASRLATQVSCPSQYQLTKTVKVIEITSVTAKLADQRSGASAVLRCK